MTQTNETPPDGEGLAKIFPGWKHREINTKPLKNQAEKTAAVAYVPPRIYWVRRSRTSDHPALAAGAVTTAFCLTIRRVDGARLIGPVPRTGILYPWRDSDSWCSRTWRHWTRHNASAANAGHGGRKAGSR